MFETLFFALHVPVFAAWALLIFAPNRESTRRLVHSGLIPVVMALGYGGLLFSGVVLGQSAPDAGMTSLSAVMALFSHPVGALTGWAHFLIFDLFIGAWIARDARAQGLGHAGTLPALVLSLMFGPLGLLAHMLRRWVAGKGWQLSA